MQAADYKKLIKQHLYAKNYGGVVEESSNHWNADIIGVNFNGEVNEFEIKVSIADLRGEVKAIKRAIQGGIYKDIQRPSQGYFTYNEVKVEEKVSLTKLEKHYCYLVGDRQGGMSFSGTVDEERQINSSGSTNKRECFVPYKFYFAVPTFLVEEAKSLLKDVPNYGIMDADTGEIKKNARKLDRENCRESDMRNLFMRACTEWRQDQYTLEGYRDIVENGRKIYVKRDYKRRDW